MRRGIVLAAWALAMTAVHAHAQVVGGVVLEEGSEAPVDGAMVILMDPAGGPVRRVLSDATGRFSLAADHVGPHRIRVDRIGYESLTTPAFDVPSAGTFQSIRVPIQAVQLRGLSVEGSTRCQLRPEQGSATARVWEEARKALEAAAWTLESGMYRYTLLQFERRLDDQGKPTGEGVEHIRRGWAQAPYVSISAEELVDHGFVQANTDSTMSYFAPDAAVLLSDAFLDSHCMHLEEGGDGTMGLDFGPIRGRTLPDIEGTLWLDAESASLRDIEFHYVNHPVLRDVGEGGGEVSFARMPNGSWVVREWSIRMPLIGAERDGRDDGPLRPGDTGYRIRAGGRTDARGRPQITGYLVQGGTLRRATDREGTAVLEAASGTVSGRVVDSLNALPVAGGLVTELEDPVESRSARIGAGGSFILPGLTPGDRRLRVTHPSLDTLGLTAPSFRVPSVAGEIASVRFRLPGVGESLREACYGSDVDRGTGAIAYGRIRSQGAPAEGARVRLTWLQTLDVRLPAIAAPAREGAEPLQWAPDPEDRHAVVTTVDDRGVFLACGLPEGARFRVEAELGEEAAPPRDLAITREGEILVETLRIGSVASGTSADLP